MSTGQLAKTGTGLSLLGIAYGQVGLVGGIFVGVGLLALVIRARFRRGRMPHDQ